MIKTAVRDIISHMYTKNYNNMMYGSWDREWHRQKILSFWTHFLLDYPKNDPKNQNFLKMGIMPGDFILLHMCTINADHMIYIYIVFEM